MIALLARLLRWVRGALTHTEHYDGPDGSWPHTYNDLQPELKAPDPGDVERAEKASSPEITHYVESVEVAEKRIDGRFKLFADGLVGEDITDLDITNVDELRRVYGPAGIIPDEKLVQWAQEARAGTMRDQEIRDRIAEIEAQGPQPVENTGYIPVTGSKAGSSPKHGVVMPPKVTDLTTKEWCDLKLEKAFGLGKLPSTVRPGVSGFSMRYLNGLRNRAEARDPSLSAYDIAILRSRGLV